MRQKLSTEFRRRLADANKSFRDIARELHVPDATLRTWMARNKFPAKEAVAIAELLGWQTSENDILSDFEIGGGQWINRHSNLSSSTSESLTLRHVFRILDRRRDYATPPTETFERDLGLSLSALRNGDLCVFVSATVTPHEFEPTTQGQSLAAQIARGIAGGGRILYLRPTQNVIDEYRNFWHLSQILELEDMEREITYLRQHVAQRLLGEHNFRRANATDRAYRHISQFYCTKSLFWAPGFILGMLQTQDEFHNLDRRMIVRLPGAVGGLIYRGPDEVFSSRFCEFVNHAIRERKKSLKKQTNQGPGKSPMRFARSSRGKNLARDQEILRDLESLIEAKFPTKLEPRRVGV